MTYTDGHIVDDHAQDVNVEVQQVVNDYNDDNCENENTEFLDITVQAPASEIEQTMATVAMAEDNLQAIMDDVSRLWQGIIHTSSSSSADVNDDGDDGDDMVNTEQSATIAHHSGGDVMMMGEGDEGIPHSTSTLNLVGPQTDVPFPAFSTSSSFVNTDSLDGEVVMQQQQQQQQCADDYDFVVIDVDGSGDVQEEAEEGDAVESGGDVQVELETRDFVGSESQVHEETGDGVDGAASFAMAMEEYAQENILDPSAVDSGMVLDVQSVAPVEQHHEPSDSTVQDVSAALVPSHMADPTDGISVITMMTLDEAGTEIGESIADDSGGKLASEPGELSITATADNADKLESIAPKQRTFAAAKALFVVVIGFSMALASHIASGTQPVFSSYMQNTAKVPPLSLNFIASTSMLITIFLPVKIIMTIFGCLKRRIKSRKLKRQTSLSQYPSTQPSGYSSMARLFNQIQSIRPSRALKFLRKNNHLVRQLVSRIALTGFVLALFALLLILRSVSILFGARFAQPTYVALIRLLEPFFTTVLGVTVAFSQNMLSKKKARRKYQEQQNYPIPKDRRKRKSSFPIFPILITLWLAVAFVGGALIVVGMTSRSEDGIFTWHLDVRSLTQKFTTLDAVGVGLSLCSVLLQSIYNIFIMFLMAPSKPTNEPSGSPSPVIHNDGNHASSDPVDLEAQNPIQGQSAQVQRKSPRGRTMRFSGFDLVLIQFIVYSCGFLFLGGVTGEIAQWDQWLQLSVMDYLIGFLYAFLVFFAVDILYAYASKLISSQNVASIMATSLLSTMCLSWIISGEPISNLWMIVGAALVVVAITFFITTRRIAANRSLKRAMAKSSTDTEVTGHVSEIQHTSASVHGHESDKFVDAELSMNQQAAAAADVAILDSLKHPEPDSDMVRDISDESLFEKPTMESATMEMSSPNVASEIHDAISAAVAVLESSDDHS